MAQNVLIQMVDDLDGVTSDDVTTRHFGLDGVTYEIDLSDSNADKLRSALADFVTAARRTGGRLKRGGASTNGHRDTDAGAVREWAQANGIELAARGRIPAHVAESYRQAKAEEKPAPAKTRSRAKK